MVILPFLKFNFKSVQKNNGDVPTPFPIARHVRPRKKARPLGSIRQCTVRDHPGTIFK